MLRAIDIANLSAEGSNRASQFDMKSEQEVNFSHVSGRKKTNFHVSEFFNDEGKAYVKSCDRCGNYKQMANSKECPALKVKCNKCRKMGHYAKYCLNSRKPQAEVKQTSIEARGSNSYKDDNFEIFTGHSCKSVYGSHKTIDLKVNGSLLTLEVKLP